MLIFFSLKKSAITFAKGVHKSELKFKTGRAANVIFGSFLKKIVIEIC